MTPERWQQIDKLFERAAEQEPGQRAAFLDEACAGDEELRREVESLLAYHNKTDQRLDHPALELTARKLAAEPPLLGRMLGPYKIQGLLGAGGMGEVYKARDGRLNRTVAIKVIPRHLSQTVELRRRFSQEAKATSALNHPNIITIYDIIHEDGRDFIVMEHVEGKTLEKLIPRKGMPLKEALKIAIPVADALAKAHGTGIIHRDLKPGNVIVGDNGQVKVLDFGLAKLAPQSRSDQAGADTQAENNSILETQTGVILGTASYMSPEQAEGKPVDHRSDIFSFGAVLYEMVTGRRAFQGDSRLATLTAILREEPKAAGQVVEGVPLELDRVLQRCLRKAPERRFQSAADLKVVLEEIKQEVDSGSVQADDVATAPIRKGRSTALMWAAISVAAIALVVAGWLWFGRSETAQPEAALSAVPLTTYPGCELSPSFSPDGKQVAFVQAETDPYLESVFQQRVDIYIKQIGVEDPSRFTDDPAPDLNPAWSPDGQSIAFARWFSPERVAYIVKPQRGGPERTVAEFTDPGGAAWPERSYWTSPGCTWTADSQGLVVVGMSAERLGKLFLVRLQSLEKRPLTDPPPRLGDGDPAISPDGRVLVFSRRDSGGRGDLWRLNLAEDLTPVGKPEKLTIDGSLNRHPAWMPEGSEIVYSGAPGLFRLALSSGAKPLRLAVTGDAPAISRQGHRLAYEVGRTDSNIQRVVVPVLGAKPTETMEFISSTRPEYEPRFSPDGTKIAFTSGRSGSLEIWICNSDGSQLFSLTSFGKRTWRPRWSPDGRRIVFQSDTSGNPDIYVIDAGGGGLRQLTDHPSSDGNPNPDWSADGKWIYFASNRTGSKQLWKVSVTGGDAVPVREISGGSGVESPDGKFLYYDHGTGGPDNYGIWRVPTSGGAETQFIDRVHPTGGWVVMDDGIYYISQPNEKGTSYIRFKEFATGSDQAVVPIEGRVDWGLSVSPDRRTFLYELAKESGSDLMLVENFR